MADSIISAPKLSAQDWTSPSIDALVSANALFNRILAGTGVGHEELRSAVKQIESIIGDEAPPAILVESLADIPVCRVWPFTHQWIDKETA